ncbi:1-acyl-sn-glycerol-3-phosphate acyltransferase-like isoform X1 [Phoenix dactylifera]|uniref:1-acyl-sn-glycerol-3-phosphate acyltransferase-like isoform X1 n=1 Tax=Phoenix dactylifera TaxID=42345 RepID=A0A8B8ZGN6_PHODC|nr:1-acyl-sn-glycerol-3-phosphate acyltransferase-like isoform X1 [Phoenix dactylifera]XP_038973316.1 1-acyl-sn-glycerol-3-phosphate acyltransferase-like isoform X1 [Phoenix dactylifera]XP_038973317.1 1-acyl-sn-glycerol-3-phosphate acyltransferase-like isoform X1 [Phoenix dactylifera]
MDASGGSPFLQGRRSERCFEESFRSTGPAMPRPNDAAGQPSRRPADTADFVDDDSWITVILSVVRIAACFLSMMVTTIVWGVIMLVLLPWPYARIRQGNLYGHVTGRMLIIWYPLLGQIFALANHLRIDRSNQSTAIESIKEVAREIVKKNLSLIIFPEGTRSKTGRLLAFKKGFVHIALQTRLPIVPMVLTSTHLAWRKNSLRVRPTPLTVKYLPPIKTDDWEAEKVNDYVEMVHALYVDHLPESQKPLVSNGRDVSSRSSS